jgi:hypothetical protein
VFSLQGKSVLNVPIKYVLFVGLRKGLRFKLRQKGGDIIRRSGDGNTVLVRYGMLIMRIYMSSFRRKII